MAIIAARIRSKALFSAAASWPSSSRDVIFDLRVRSPAAIPSKSPTVSDNGPVTDRLWRLLNLQIWGDTFITGRDTRWAEPFTCGLASPHA